MCSIQNSRNVQHLLCIHAWLVLVLIYKYIQGLLHFVLTKVIVSAVNRGSLVLWYCPNCYFKMVHVFSSMELCCCIIISPIKKWYLSLHYVVVEHPQLCPVSSAQIISAVLETPLVSFPLQVFHKPLVAYLWSWLHIWFHLLWQPWPALVQEEAATICHWRCGDALVGEFSATTEATAATHVELYIRVD